MSTKANQTPAGPVPGRARLRAWNIAFRTAHICATGVLFGGHVWGIASGRLLPWLYLSILTGVVLTGLEVAPDRRWFVEGRGALVIAKLLLLCLVPWLPSCRVPLLSAVVVIASVGSHMPRALRHRRVFGRAGSAQR